MKKITFTLLISLMFISANAQDILDTVTNEVCSCIQGKKDKLQGLDKNKLQAQLGLCILSSYTAHEAAVKKQYGDVLANESKMEKFGADIGVKMIGVCPDTLLEIAGAADTGEDEATATDTAAEVISIEGKITEIKNEQFTSILVKDKNSRVFTFLVLDYFDTASVLVNNELKVNSAVVVKYSEVELYDNKAKEFRYFKVVTGIEKK